MGMFLLPGAGGDAADGHGADGAGSGGEATCNSGNTAGCGR